MISVSGKIWTEKKLNNRIIEKISVENKFSYDLSKLILNRNYTTNELNELKYELELFNPFSKNQDFLKARDLLIKIVKKKGLVLIYGDYDVDGVSSIAILVNFFNSFKHPNYYLIPNRFSEGYGPNIDLIKKNLKKNTEIVIFVDCGTNSNETIKFLKKKKIDDNKIHKAINFFLKKNILALKFYF